MIVRKHARFRFFLDAFRAVCAAILGLSVVLWLLLSTQALLDAPVLPALSSLVQLSMGLIPAVLALALPLGLLFGCTAAAWNWRTDGELLALNASGLGGRTLLPSVAAART